MGSKHNWRTVGYPQDVSATTELLGLSCWEGPCCVFQELQPCRTADDISLGSCFAPSKTLGVSPLGEGLQNSTSFISPRPVVQVWSVFSNRSYLQQPRAMAVAYIAVGVLDFLDQQLEGIYPLSGNRVFVKSMALAHQVYSSCGVTPFLCKHIE